MSAEVTAESHLEIAHVLFVDIVAYSKLLSSEQRELFALLNDVVRNTSQFRAAEAASEREQALEHLEVIARLPAGPTFGDLRLSPLWDPLRGYPRFEKIVASVAPKDGKR